MKIAQDRSGTVPERSQASRDPTKIRLGPFRDPLGPWVPFRVTFGEFLDGFILGIGFEGPWVFSGGLLGAPGCLLGASWVPSSRV